MGDYNYSKDEVDSIRFLAEACSAGVFINIASALVTPHYIEGVTKPKFAL